ncbi:MAG TPA: ABC transporter substrate-binding protein [Xanthobacteraceae bacterium]|jgi:NitT/TauT family transport system substrate-binding protein|nr:ABC transporter substrate-binding protein [Xanthobacteraceae bacterium]
MIPVGLRALSRRDFLVAAAVGGLAGAMARSSAALAQETVRIALPTKTYYPTIISEAAQRHKLFDKEGLTAELTVYRGGAEAFEAVAAGAADITLGSCAIVAAGIRKGVKSKAISGASLGYNGWYLMVKSDSKIKDIAELEGKKVGITSAGSASDILAKWTMSEKKVKFTAVPLGGGGLIPNLLTGNVDAIVIYSPLSFKVMQDKSARSLLDYGEAVPAHLSGVWIAPDKLIDEKPELIQKVNNALFGGMAALKADRPTAIKLIAEIDEISPKIAEAELDGNILKLSTTGEMTPVWVQRSLDLAKLVGMTNLAPASEIYTTKFKPVPTRL